MGVSYNASQIVTDGLVMNLDASNPRSVANQNLFRYSQEFSNGVWIRNNGVSVTTTSLTSPIGTLNTQALTSVLPTGSAAEYYRLIYQDVTPQQTYKNVATSFTFSIYVKNINALRSNIALQISNYNFDGGGFREVVQNFNVFTGTVTGGMTQSGSWTGSATATSVGDGWYRFSITANTSANSYANLRCSVWLGGFAGSISSEDLGSVALWGAQLEASTSVGTYQQTEGTAIETTWNDLSGNNNNAYPTSIAGYGGPVTYNSSGFFDFSMNSPASNGAGQGSYNGNGFIMAANNNVVPIQGSFTLNAIIRRNLTVKAAGDRETIFSNAQGADGWRFGIETGVTNALYYLISGANGVGYQEGAFGSITNLTNGNWHMMTIVYDRAAQLGSYSIIGYVDGALSGTVAITSGASGNVPFSLQLLTPGIGYAGCCDVFAGQIAVVQAYKKALTATEVAQNFAVLRGRYGI